MVKDRLAELQRLSSQSRDALLDQEAWSDMDTFLANIENIRSKLDEMEALLKQLAEIHRTILISPASDPKYNAEMNEVVSNFKALTKSVSGFLSGLAEEVKRIGNQNDASSRIKKDQSRTLTRAFHNLLNDFNEEQLHYKSQCEKTIAKFLRISGVQLDEDQVDQAIEKGELFNTVSLLMGDREKKALYEDVKSRHDDIIKLEASIRELHEIFQDMAMLVESQGEILDRIDQNVQYATDYSKKALSNVNQAQQAQRRNMMLKFGILICGIITVIILFIVFSAAFYQLINQCQKFYVIK
ncbi:unnamed protein product [Bursaphelenchus xylophilus]|uniref:(pine wood nematode) hypothetical protein n=1 Tax=Bursaphelenchus xylophilus TaxID=6326 RepID=A0A811KKM9_BURXY|nr:unnamed protein product [Bursaphelenchus xylophilus]CAG9099236.1 unnamed protein product [Bursaphelenchus xylophilus]